MRLHCPDALLSTSCALRAQETFSLTSEISHPVEFIFNILLPLVAGPFLMAYNQGVHIATFWIWISFRCVCVLSTVRIL